MRKLVRVGLASALALGAASACRGDITKPGKEFPGDFFVELEGHKDTTAAGDALFYESMVDGVELLTLELATDNSRFQMSFAIREFSGGPEEHDIALNPERYSGTFSYTAGGVRVTYQITGGTISLTDVTKQEIHGEFNFSGLAIEGPNEGDPGHIQGSFQAVCGGDCLGTGPPPGS